MCSMRWILLAFAGCSFSGPTTGLSPVDAPPGSHDTTVEPPVDSTVTPHPDAPGITDSDGDGVPDASDNCPTMANPNQANEDGDALGDACDPCPISSANTADADGDGVPDACDPRPNTGGDHIAFFQGFAGGIPTDWTGDLASFTGTKTISGTGTGKHVGLLLPTDKSSVMAEVTLNSGLAAGIGMRQGGTVMSCALYNFQGTGVSLHYDDAHHAESTFAVSGAIAFELVLSREGNAYNCSANGDATTSVSPPGSSFKPDTDSLEVSGTGAFQWIMVVTHD